MEEEVAVEASEEEEAASEEETEKKEKTPQIIWIQNSTNIGKREDSKDMVQIEFGL